MQRVFVLIFPSQNFNWHGHIVVKHFHFSGILKLSVDTLNGLKLVALGLAYLWLGKLI